MTREEIINQLRPFFQVKELVCPHTYKKYGEASWRFLDTMYLWCLLVIRRDILQVRMDCNNGTTLTQRGLRCNLCSLVKSKRSLYLSAHTFGKAGDFSSPSMTAQQMRNAIIENADKLPCPIRIEDEVTWLHFDVMPFDSPEKVYLFKA